MRVSRAEFISRVDDLTDQAETEPVTITQGGRDRVVLVSAGEYARLKGQDDRAAGAEISTGNAAFEIDQPGVAKMPDLWGALKHTIIYVSDDIAEPIGEIWDAER
jgi:prevent-host-death family protein